MSPIRLTVLACVLAEPAHASIHSMSHFSIDATGALAGAGSDRDGLLARLAKLGFRVRATAIRRRWMMKLDWAASRQYRFYTSLPITSVNTARYCAPLARRIASKGMPTPPFVRNRLRSAPGRMRRMRSHLPPCRPESCLAVSATSSSEPISTTRARA